MGIRRLGSALLLVLVALVVLAPPASSRPLRFELRLRAGEPDALAAGETALVELLATDNKGVPLVGEPFQFELTGADFTFGPQATTDYDGLILAEVQALCVDFPKDIVVTAYPASRPQLAQSITLLALGGNDPILHVVNTQEIARVGEPLTIYCHLDDPCGDPTSDEIFVDLVNGSYEVVWTEPGRFQVVIDTSGAPAEGYRETITIHTASGASQEASVRVLSDLYALNWMYLSVAVDHYDSGMDEPYWDEGIRSIYAVVEIHPDVWQAGDGYSALEFSVEYPPELFFTGLQFPQSPGSLGIGGCDAGHCNWLIGSPYKVESNPWAGVQMGFQNFGAGDNLLFLFGPSDNGGRDAPAWAFHDQVGVVVYEPREPADTSGGSYRPDWAAGVVLLNANPETMSPETHALLEARIHEPAHPLWSMVGVGTGGESWGSLKARYGK